MVLPFEDKVEKVLGLVAASWPGLLVRGLSNQPAALRQNARTLLGQCIQEVVVEEVTDVT
jgi:hypothetical protein